MDRSSKQNISKDIVGLNNALDELDLTDIYRAFYPKDAKYTFFLSVLRKDKQNQQALKQHHQEKKREDQINTIRNERGETTTDTTKIQSIVRHYYKELYAKKCENLDEIDKSLENIPFQNSMKEK